MVRMYFGSPGSGKTCLARRLLLHEGVNYKYTFANFETKLAMYIDPKALGSFIPPPGSLIVIDEAGIVFNNRNFKDMKLSIIEFFKKHRHCECDIIIISQSWEDVDITIRRLTDELYYLSKVGPFTIIRRINKKIHINKDTHEIVEGYFKTWVPHMFFRPLYYDKHNKYDPPVRKFIPNYENAEFLIPNKWYHQLWRWCSSHFWLCFFALVLFFFL